MRADPAHMIQEQAALRRVATLVAHGVPAGELFGAVAEEVGRLLDADLAGMIRFEEDGGVVAVATWAAVGRHLDVPGRWSLDGDRLATKLASTGLPTREDAWEEVDGPIAAFVRQRLGVRSSVGSPVIVESRVWGALFVHSTQARALPADTEQRLGNFTKLVATAVANAQARSDLEQLADEQAALHRVATLVARASSPAETLANIAREVATLLEVDAAAILRYEPDETVTVMSGWGHPDISAFVGQRLPADGDSPTAKVRRTLRPGRRDDWSHAAGALAELNRNAGITSSVAGPVIVDGRPWGTVSVSTTGPSPLPPTTESRVAQFAKLVATAIANAQARGELQRLADEQAALRRVATLVARQAPPGDTLTGIAEELATLLAVDGAVILRYEADRSATVVAGWGEPGLARYVGDRFPLDGDNPAADVLRTWRPARREDWSNAHGVLAQISREAGIRSSLASPVVVDAELWGSVVIVTLDAAPFPADTEARVAQFTELVATAIGNVKTRSELTESRARMVHTADRARQRFERDLHDGVQQRLVSIALDLRRIEAALPAELERPRSGLSEAVDRLTDALDDLRELSRGLHPAVLAESGLEPALRALARRSAVPVALELDVPRRLAEEVEVTAYFVVSELLANAAKHADASVVEVRATALADVLELRIGDDGKGGADPARGSGLSGLIDRVDALGGRIAIASPPAEGTSLHVSLPLGDA